MIKLTFGHFKSSAMNFAMAADEIVKRHSKIGGFLSRVGIRPLWKGEHVVRSEQVDLATVHESIVDRPVDGCAGLFRIGLDVQLVGTMLAHSVVITVFFGLHSRTIRTNTGGAWNSGSHLTITAKDPSTDSQHCRVDNDGVVGPKAARGNNPLARHAAFEIKIRTTN